MAEDPLIGLLLDVGRLNQIRRGEVELSVALPREFSLQHVHDLPSPRRVVGVDVPDLFELANGSPKLEGVAIGGRDIILDRPIRFFPILVGDKGLGSRRPVPGVQRRARPRLFIDAAENLRSHLLGGSIVGDVKTVGLCPMQQSSDVDAVPDRFIRFIGFAVGGQRLSQRAIANRGVAQPPFDVEILVGSAD